MPVLKIKQDGIWKEIVGGGSSSGNGTVELDATLTKSGMAADAKAVGDAIDALDTIVAVDENNDGNVELGTIFENNKLPLTTANDNGKFLKVVNGVPAWVAISNAEEASF